MKCAECIPHRGSKRRTHPKGDQLHGRKLYHLERLCFPSQRVTEMVKAHREWNGHQGAEWSRKDLELHYEFPGPTKLDNILQRVRRSCLTCQACSASSQALTGPIGMTPIPPRVMSSVALDVFSMPSVEWRGKVYDAFLMCVDRHSGWMLVRPTRKEGLTGEEAAHLLLDNGWGEFGVPSVIVADQGHSSSPNGGGPCVPDSA